MECFYRCYERPTVICALGDVPCKTEGSHHDLEYLVGYFFNWTDPRSSVNHDLILAHRWGETLNFPYAEYDTRARVRAFLHQITTYDFPDGLLITPAYVRRTAVDMRTSDLRRIGKVPACLTIGSASVDPSTQAPKGNLVHDERVDLSKYDPVQTCYSVPISSNPVDILVDNLNRRWIRVVSGASQRAQVDDSCWPYLNDEADAASGVRKESAAVRETLR